MTDIRISPAVGEISGGVSSDAVSPEDQGWVGWSVDPAACDNTITFSLGVSYVVRIPTRSHTPIAGLLLPLLVAATAPTSGQCWASVHDSSGIIRGTGQLSGLDSAGFATASWSAYTPTDDYVFARFLVNASVACQGLRGTGSAGTFSTIVNYPLSASASRFATLGSGLTSLASFDPTSLVQTNSVCVGLI